MKYAEHELMAALMLLMWMVSNKTGESADKILTRYRNEGYLVEDGSPNRVIRLTAKGRFAAQSVLEELYAADTTRS